MSISSFFFTSFPTDDRRYLYFRMNVLEIAKNLNNTLCKLLGLASPWSDFSAHSAAYKTFVHILYLYIPIVLFYLDIVNPVFGDNHINALLSTLNIASQIVEIYVNIYLYGYLSDKNNDFRHSSYENRKQLKYVFNSTTDNVSRRGVFMTSLITFLLFGTMFSCVVLIFCGLPVRSLLMILRHLVVIPISLQWTIFMLYVDKDLSRVRTLLKSVVLDNGVDLDKLEMACLLYTSRARPRATSCKLECT